MIKQKVRCELVVDRTREYRIFMTNTNLMDFVQFVLMLMLTESYYMLLLFFLNFCWCHFENELLSP